MKKLSIIATLATSLATTSSFSSSLCKEMEKTIFSCNVKNKKTVSICRSKKSPLDNLTYRFGKPDRIELEHTDSVGEKSSFYYNDYHRFQTQYFEIGFKNKSHRYGIFIGYNEEFPDPEYVLTVSKAENPEIAIASFDCIDSIQEDALSDIKDVPCNMESALGC